MANPPHKQGEYPRIQRWLLTAITHPGGLEEGLSRAGAQPETRDMCIENLVMDGPNLSAEECLGVYAEMYFWRLVDILEDDFPVLRYALGEDDFRGLATRCLDANPPSGASLQFLGRSLPHYIREGQPSFEHTPSQFLAEIAELELRMEECFDADKDTSLSSEALSSSSAEALFSVEFKGHSSLSLQSTTYPVATYAKAVLDEGTPSTPTAEASWWAVIRPHHEVNIVELDRTEFLLLQAIINGNTLADALERTLEEEGVSPDAMMSQLHDWFLRWGALGFFSGFTRRASLSDPVS